MKSKRKSPVKKAAELIREDEQSFDSEIDVDMPMTQHAPHRNDSSFELGDGDKSEDGSEILLLSEKQARDRQILQQRGSDISEEVYEMGKYQQFHTQPLHSDNGSFDD